MSVVYCTPIPLASRLGILVTPNIQSNRNKAACNRQVISMYSVYIKYIIGKKKKKHPMRTHFKVKHRAGEVPSQSHQHLHSSSLQSVWAETDHSAGDVQK